MSFDAQAIRRAIARHGPVWRVTVASVAGSAPREVGAAMLVVQGRVIDGTIGGGALEYQAAREAETAPRLARHALGPGLGQCCGGAVTLLTERWEAADLDELGEIVARGPGAMPLAVKRLLTEARGGGGLPPVRLVGDWMVEPAHTPERQIWVWGAGHVGRAITGVLAPIPDLAIRWVDTAPERFPDPLPEGVERLVAVSPPDLVPHAPREAEHLILTYSHEIDLALCHALLSHGFASAGLIGSATKWARFRSRLRDLGHTEAQISRIHCPIGQPELGKHPQAIAVGVAAALLLPEASSRTRETG